MHFRCNVVDIANKKVFFGEVTITDGIISAITPLSGKGNDYILPGFVDAHVHIESSMLVPSEFARLAVVHGTVATVSDPHEIANVLGLQGVRYMIDNGKKVPFKFYFGAPSCVPATAFETSGAHLGVSDVELLLQDPDIKYLAEMMNYPGVLSNDEEVMNKIRCAHQLGKPIDGHAPGLRGENAKKYIAAGISTDHECFTYEEALEKLQAGMKIIIREGSAAKNFDALIDLLPQYPRQIMFCSDDKHPDDLILGHINTLVARALKAGVDLFDALQAACVNPVLHYQLGVGLLRPGDPADFIITSDLHSFAVKSTYVNGQLVALNGESRIRSVKSSVVNHFSAGRKRVEDFRLEAQTGSIRAIKAIDGEIITDNIIIPAKIVNGFAVSDLDRDLLKIAVVNRYEDNPPALAFAHNFGLKRGAIASCVAHDSHNIIAIGADDESLSKVVNLLIDYKGGIAAVYSDQAKVLSLPVAGIMSNEDGYAVAAEYSGLDQMVKNRMGCTLSAPFMTLSFMALLVIPQLKISDRGLFDVKSFRFISVFS